MLCIPLLLKFLMVLIFSANLLTTARGMLHQEHDTTRRDIMNILRSDECQFFDHVDQGIESCQRALVYFSYLPDEDKSECPNASDASCRDTDEEEILRCSFVCYPTFQEIQMIESTGGVAQPTAKSLRMITIRMREIFLNNQRLALPGPPGSIQARFEEEQRRRREQDRVNQQLRRARQRGETQNLQSRRRPRQPQVPLVTSAELLQEEQELERDREFRNLFFQRYQQWQQLLQPVQPPLSGGETSQVQPETNPSQQPQPQQSSQEVQRIRSQQQSPEGPEKRRRL